MSLFKKRAMTELKGQERGGQGIHCGVPEGGPGCLDGSTVPRGVSRFTPSWAEALDRSEVDQVAFKANGNFLKERAFTSVLLALRQLARKYEYEELLFQKSDNPCHPDRRHQA
jgi:hypothetical protein